MFAIGIDSHKDTLAAYLVDHLGTPVEYRNIANTPNGHRQLVDWAQTHNAVRVAIEGSGTYGRPAAVAAVTAGLGCSGGATPVDRPGSAPGPYPDQNRPGRRVGDCPDRSPRPTVAPPTFWEDVRRWAFFSSAISVVSVRIRRARERMAILVAVCSLREPEVGWPGRNLWVLVTSAAVFRLRSWSLRSTGAVTTRALSSLMAATRAVCAPRRTVSSTRSRERPSAWRAARRASNASVLAPSRVGWGWPNSITHSPASER